MTDNRMQNQSPAGRSNPYMRPMRPQQLVRNDQTRRVAEPVGPYTPNEPDQNEVIYAARAAAARQQQMARQQARTVAGQASAPVQHALEQAAMQAHAARQTGYTPARPARPDATFYQQATGVQQPNAQPQAPAQPVRQQPHRLPMDARQPYGQPVRAAQPQGNAQPAQGHARIRQPYAQGIPADGSISRRTDAAVLADPMLAEEASQTAPMGRRRSRMVMRQEQATDVPMESSPVTPIAAAPQPVPAASQPPAPETLREKAEQAKTNLQQALQPQAAASAAEAQPDAPEPMPQPMPDIPAQPQLDAAALAAQAFQDPLEGLSWGGDDAPDEDEDSELEDCMDTSRMPIPAPVSTFDLPKEKRNYRLLILLAAVMLVIAAGSFLWLSGLGQRLINGAGELVQSFANPTVATGPMTVSPEAAALPARLTVTLTTDATVTDLRLLAEDGQPFAAEVASAAQGEEILWTCTLLLEEPYDGLLRTELLCRGEWKPGSESRYIQVN